MERADASPRSLTAAIQLDRRLAVLVLTSCHQRRTHCLAVVYPVQCSQQSMTAWGLWIKTPQCLVTATRNTQHSVTIDSAEVISPWSRPDGVIISFPFAEKVNPQNNIHSPNTDGSSKFVDFGPSCLIFLSLFQQWPSWHIKALQKQTVQSECIIIISVWNNQSHILNFCFLRNKNAEHF